MINKTAFFTSIRQSEFAGVLSQSQVDGFNILLDAAPPAWDVRWLAYALATVIWETKLNMQPVREAYWLSEAWRKAHLRYYPYYGRGFPQITWSFNYKKFSPLVGVDLFADPEKAMDPTISAKILFIGSEKGLFSGRSLGDFITADRTDYFNARAVINGVDKAAQIAAIAVECHTALIAA